MIYNSSSGSLSSRHASLPPRKRSSATAKTPSPKRQKGADASWAEGRVYEEDEHDRWRVGQGDSPLLCAEQL